MPHINDLPVDVIWWILYWAAATPAKRLSEWKQKLPLVAVCREWTKLAQPFVFSHVYVESVQKCDDEPLTDASSNATSIVWTSNAELLISRQCTLMAGRLTLRMVEFVTPGHLRRIALDILQLDHVDWMYINTLNFGEYSSNYVFHDEKPIASEPDRAEVARTMQYFGQNMRNIAELNYTGSHLGDMGYLVGDAFASMYGGQLLIIRAQVPVPFSVPHLSRHIAVLELNLDLHSVRPIVFPRLTSLDISYEYYNNELTKDEVQRKITSGAYNCDQLQFPVLKRLEINNCAPDCDLLYADTPFPELEEVELSGTLDELCYYSRLKLAWVGDLTIYLSLHTTDDTTAFYSITNHLLSSICIGRTACLSIFGDLVSIDPELVRWANLTYLRVEAVSYETFCELIARLPNLEVFITINLELGTILEDIISLVDSLFLSTDPLLAWGAKLTMIKIAELDDSFPIAVSARRIQALIVPAGALERLIIPQSIKPSVVAFINKYKDRCPHLANIRVLT
ncbi:hypothetical protein GGF42_000263 [Coemansia sp. RSA 2424]|nr:hypothetical protein GGF42_000263 [Coemansia sp. RSA 2424]